MKYEEIAWCPNLVEYINRNDRITKTTEDINSVALDDRMTKTTDDRNSVALNGRRTKMTDDRKSVCLNKEDKRTRYILRKKEYVSCPSAIDMIPRKVDEGRYTCAKSEEIQPGTSKTASTKKVHTMKVTDNTGNTAGPTRWSRPKIVK